MGVAAKEIRSDARGRLGGGRPGGDMRRGRCSAGVIVTQGQILSIITPSEWCLWDCERGRIIHSIVTDCPVCVCSSVRRT